MARVENLWQRARRETDQKLVFLVALFLVLVALAGDEKLTRFRVGHEGRSGRAHKHDHVMRDGAIAGADLGALDPFVLGESARDDEVLILDHALFGHGEFLLHLEYHVRFADVPAFDKLDRFRLGRGFAFGRSRVGPRYDRVDFFLRQRAIVRKFFTHMRIRKPRRHAFQQHGFLDARGPRPRFFVGQQRHRRHFTGAMAVLAALLHDRQHILIEGDCGGILGSGECRGV